MSHNRRRRSSPVSFTIVRVGGRASETPVVHCNLSRLYLAFAEAVCPGLFAVGAATTMPACPSAFHSPPIREPAR